MKEAKGYKQTEVGLIPNDWDAKEIGGEIDYLTGFPFKSNKYSNDGTKLLRGANIKRGNTDWSKDITAYWKELNNDIKKYLLKAGDIVIAMDGSLVGKSFAQIKEEDLPALLLQRVARIRSAKIDLNYLKQFIGSDYFVQYCDSVKTVTAIPHISSDNIKEFRIPIPPTLKEQQAIATTLSETDSFIDSLEKLITKKRNIKQGMMQKLLAPKKDWEVKTYGEVFNFLNTATYSRAELTDGDKVGYVHYGDIHTRLTNFLDADKISLPSVTNEKVKNYSLLQEGDLIMADASEDYSGIGKSVEVRNINNRKTISGLHTFLLRDRKEVFVNGLKGYLHECSYIKNQFDKLATGMKVYGVSKNNLKLVQISIPPKTEQNRIITILNDIDSDLNHLGKNSRNTKC